MDHSAELNDFQVWWALRPVVAPAHDDIAPVRRVAMVSEVSALELELDSHPLPFASVHLALCLAVREPGLNGFDVIPQFTSDHSEEEHDALLVDRLVKRSRRRSSAGT